MFGSTWATPSLPQYQFPSDRLSFEPSMTSPTPPLNKLPSDRLWLQPLEASCNPALLNHVRAQCTLRLRTDNAEDSKSLLRTRRGSTLDENVRGRARGSTASENLPVVFAQVSWKVRGSSRAEASFFRQIYVSMFLTAHLASLLRMRRFKASKFLLLLYALLLPQGLQESAKTSCKLQTKSCQDIPVQDLHGQPRCHQVHHQADCEEGELWG